MQNKTIQEETAEKIYNRSRLIINLNKSIFVFVHGYSSNHTTIIFLGWFKPPTNLTNLGMA
jgi:hypothetical protein